ncbi:MAG: hypothetical protein OXC72_02195 [Roseovarius sp.]|nr:hypothetical protein [Roseovarius sp.]
MQPIEKFILIHGTFLFALGVTLALFNTEYFETQYVTEDGILEWLTVLALASISGMIAQRLWLGFIYFNLRQKLVLGTLALLAAFGALEEISWGQRLLAIQSPEFFQQYNAQVETNIHNLIINDVNMNKMVFAKGILIIFMVYLFVITPLCRHSARLRALADSWAVPLPKTYHVVGYLVVILAVEGLINLQDHEVSRRGELTEFAIPLLVALNIIFPRNQQVFEPWKRTS